jgi:hypothetical protein
VDNLGTWCGSVGLGLMGFLFGEHVVLSESVWFTGGEEKLLGPVECELLPTS